MIEQEKNKKKIKNDRESRFIDSISKKLRKLNLF